MNSYKRSVIVPLASFVMVALFACMGHASILPFVEAFDQADGTPLDSVNGWITEGAYAQDTNALSGRAAYVPEGVGLSNTFSSGAQDRMFSTFYTVPSLYDGTATERAVPASGSAVFFFDMNGYAVVYDGDGADWDVRASDYGGSAAAPLTGGWARVTVFHDYPSNTWSLFVAADGATDKLVASGMGFLSPQGAYQMFSATHDVYLDDVDITDVLPVDLQSDVENNGVGDGMPDAYELYYFGTVDRDGTGDFDGDGRTDAQEEQDGTDPTDETKFAVTMPFLEDFEQPLALGYKTEAFNFISPNGAGVEVVDGTDEYIEGSQGLSLCTNSAISVAITDNDATNVWCVMSLKPSLFDSLPSGTLDNSEAAGFLVLASGVVCVYETNEWVETSVTVPTDVWLRFGVHLDYKKRLYDLFVGTNDVAGDVMQKVTTSRRIAFNGDYNGTVFGGVVVSNSADNCMYVDDVALTMSGFDDIDDSADVDEVTTVDRDAGGCLWTAIPFEYPSAGGSNTLAGALGMDLGLGLAVDDSVKFWDNANGWRTYTWDGGVWDGPSDPATVSLYLNQPLYLCRGGGSDDIGAVAYDENTPQGTPASPLVRGDTVAPLGWNLFRRLGATALLNTGGAGGGGAGIFVDVAADATSPNNDYELRLGGNEGIRIFMQTAGTYSGNWINIQGLPVGYSLSEEQRYWIFNEGDGDLTITDNN